MIKRVKNVEEGEYLCMDWFLCHRPWYKKFKTTNWREI